MKLILPLLLIAILAVWLSDEWRGTGILSAWSLAVS
jgi:hypothetical protein